MGWVGLGWVGLGWAGLGWAGLSWVGLESDSARPALKNKISRFARNLSSRLRR